MCCFLCVVFIAPWAEVGRQLPDHFPLAECIVCCWREERECRQWLVCSQRLDGEVLLPVGEVD